MSLIEDIDRLSSSETLINYLKYRNSEDTDHENQQNTLSTKPLSFKQQRMAACISLKISKLRVQIEELNENMKSVVSSPLLSPSSIRLPTHSPQSSSPFFQNHNQYTPTSGQKVDMIINSKSNNKLSSDHNLSRSSEFTPTLKSSLVSPASSARLTPQSSKEDIFNILQSIESLYIDITSRVKTLETDVNALPLNSDMEIRNSTANYNNHTSNNHNNKYDDYLNIEKLRSRQYHRNSSKEKVSAR